MNKVLAARMAMGLKQRDMAVVLGISRVSYSYKETGIRDFKDKEKQKFIEYAKWRGFTFGIDIFFDNDITQKNRRKIRNENTNY